MNFTTHSHLVPRLKISGAVPLLPIDTFMGWTGTNHIYILDLNSGLTKLFEGSCPNCLKISKKPFRVPMGIVKSRIMSWNFP